MSLTLKKRVKFSFQPLTIITKRSVLDAAEVLDPPPNNSILPSKLKLLTEHTLTSCDFSETDIPQIINSQDSNKAYGNHMISIRMLNLCGEAICRPLSIIFKTCVNTGKFPLEWKKGNVVSIHRKDYK